MKIIAELKMPCEKQDQVAQILVEGANSGTTEKLLFLSNLQRKILTYKSFKGKYSLIRASKENPHL